MGGDGIANCLEAGITTIEHGVFLTEALCARMARDGVALVPTLIAPPAIAAGGVGAGIPRSPVRKSLAGAAPPLEGFPLALPAAVPLSAPTAARPPPTPPGTPGRALR